MNHQHSQQANINNRQTHKSRKSKIKTIFRQRNSKSLNNKKKHQNEEQKKNESNLKTKETSRYEKIGKINFLFVSSLLLKSLSTACRPASVTVSRTRGAFVAKPVWLSCPAFRGPSPALANQRHPNYLKNKENDLLQNIASKNEMQLFNVFQFVPVSEPANLFFCARATHPAIVSPFGPGVVAPGEPLALRIETVAAPYRGQADRSERCLPL